MSGESPKSASIADRGYRPYRGDYTSVAGRWRLVAARGFASTLKQRWVLVFTVLGLIVTVVGAVLTYLQSTVAGQIGSAVNLRDLPLSSGIIAYKVAASGAGTLYLTLFMAIYCGGGAIADDQRTGAFQFYFSRPLRQNQYLVGKLAPVALTLAFVSLVPAFLVALLRMMLGHSPEEILSLLYLPFGAIVLGAIQALLYALVAVTLSSLVDSRSYAQALVAGALFVPLILGRMIATTTRSFWPKVLSLPDLFDAVARALFRVPASLEDRAIHLGIAASFLIAIGAGSVALLRARIAEMERRT